MQSQLIIKEKNFTATTNCKNLKSNLNRCDVFVQSNPIVYKYKCI